MKINNQSSQYQKVLLLLVILTVLLTPVYRKLKQEKLNIALSESVTKCNNKCIVALIKQGADPDISIDSSNGKMNSNVFFVILENLITRASREEKQMPILIEAVHQTKTDPTIINTLLNAGANVNIQDNEGETALSVAIEEKKNCIVMLLIKRGADVNSRDKHGYTTLMKAVDSSPYRGYPIIIKNLLCNGALIDARNDQGETALILAAERKPDIVRMLIENRADMNIEDRNGHTALSVAEWAGASETIALLKNKGAKE
jgi:ankyrin repeat protein